MVSFINMLLGNHASGDTSLSTAQMELLLCLTSQRIDVRAEKSWTPAAGPLEHNIARFISEGLMEEARIEERLDSKYKAVEIKQMLDSRGIKVKGKKQDMISILINSMTADQAESMVSDVRLFQLTPEGKDRVEAYKAGIEKARKVMESDAIMTLTKGDVRKAWTNIARYFESQNSPDPKWSRPTPDIVTWEATQLLKMPYDDLPLTPWQRKELGANLALSVLLGEESEEAGKRLMKYTASELDWANVLAFHRPNPCGNSEHQTSSESLAKEYAATRIHEALSSYELNSLKTSKMGKGIKILPIHGSDCHICHNGKFLYAWNELSQLPKLPRQLGCHCTYAAWL